MNNKTIVSCRNCSDRYPCCHQTCKTYQDERAEYDRLKAEENKGREAYYYAAEEQKKRVNKFAMDKKKPHRRGYID